jgi:uncharacterized protein (TIGR00251 family)
MIKQAMDGETSTTIAVRVTPRAKKNEIHQILDDGRVKVRLKAPPVDGKANQSLIQLLADVIGINSSQIMIVSGRKRREKLVRIKGIAPATVQARLTATLD